MKDIIKTELGEYKKVLATNDFIYYLISNEYDENGMVLMYTTTGELRSNNYFATSSYMDDMEEIINGNIKAIYVDKEELKNAKEYFKNI